MINAFLALLFVLFSTHAYGEDRCSLYPLHCAAEEGDLTLAKKLLSFGFDVNKEDDRGKAPLYYPVEKSNLELARAFLENKANPSWTKSTEPFVVVAALRGHAELLELLLTHKANADVNSLAGEPLVHIAYDKKTVLNALLKFPVDLTRTNKEGLTLLHRATVDGDFALAGVLLNLKLSVDVRDSYGLSPLRFAVRNMDLPAIEWLIKNKANVGASFDASSPLAEAISLGSEPLVKLLVKSGAKLSSTDATGPLYFVLSTGSYALARLVFELSKPFKPTLLFQERAFLSWAAAFGSANTVLRAIEAGADVNGREKDYSTALHMAVRYGNFETVSALLSKGARADLIDANGFSPLYHAVKLRHREVITLLAEKGANFELAYDTLGNNFYHMAVIDNDIALIRFLGERKVSPNFANRNCVSPLQLAMEKNLQELATALLDAGASPNPIAGCDAPPPLYKALTQNWPAAFVERLLRADAKRDYTDADGLNYAMVAIRWGYNWNIISSFLDEKSVAHKSQQKETALHYFLRRGQGGFETEQLKRFVELGADLALPDASGVPPIHLFVRRRGFSIDALKLFPDINAKDDTGKNVLHIGCQTSSDSGFPAVIELGADVEAKDNDGRTPLFHCIATSRYDTVPKILVEKSQKYSTDSLGNTALHIAAQKGTTRIVYDLLLAGFDKSALNAAQKTAFEIAATEKHWFTRRILKNHTDVIEKRDELPTDVGFHEVLKKIERQEIISENDVIVVAPRRSGDPLRFARIGFDKSIFWVRELNLAYYESHPRVVRWDESSFLLVSSVDGVVKLRRFGFDGLLKAQHDFRITNQEGSPHLVRLSDGSAMLLLSGRYEMKSAVMTSSFEVKLFTKTLTNSNPVAAARLPGVGLVALGQSGGVFHFGIDGSAKAIVEDQKLNIVQARPNSAGGFDIAYRYYRGGYWYPGIRIVKGNGNVERDIGGLPGGSVTDVVEVGDVIVGAFSRESDSILRAFRRSDGAALWLSTVDARSSHSNHLVASPSQILAVNTESTALSLFNAKGEKLWDVSDLKKLEKK